KLMDDRIVGSFPAANARSGAPSNAANDPYRELHQQMERRHEMNAVKRRVYDNNPVVKVYRTARTRHQKDFDRLKELRGMLNSTGPLPNELKQEGLTLTTRLNLRFQPEFFAGAPE